MKWGWKRPARRILASGLGLGLFVGMVGVLINPWGVMLRLETSLGLDWLFTIRGPRSAPADVMVIAIDDQSAKALGLPSDTAEWSRALHARLVNRLQAMGADVIVFDMAFEDSRDSDGDGAFAEALEKSGRVVLFQRLSRPRLSDLGSDDPELEDRIRSERLEPLLEAFRSKAAGIGPFPLPKVPVRIDQYWTFKQGAGDAATLPVVALHVFAKDTLGDYRKRIGHSAQESKTPSDSFNHIADSLRQHLIKNPSVADSARTQVLGIASNTPDRSRELMLALFDVHVGPQHRYLDFYGPPRTVSTLSYAAALTGPMPPLHGKAVFIGASNTYQPVQQDGFFTVFSQIDGTDLGGVEIAATAFANLLERRSVRPLPPLQESVLLLSLGLFLGLILRGLPLAWALPGAALMGLGYLGSAFALFSHNGLWLPLVTPMVIQLPLAIGLTLYLSYARSQHDRTTLQKTFSRYLPPKVVHDLVDHPDAVGPAPRTANGVCLITDAQKFSSLAERLPPNEMRALLNRYFKALFRPVERRAGFVSDVFGDSMVALWVSAQPDLESRRQACLAALDILGDVDRFNRSEPTKELPTRIGIHCGELVLGDVGAGQHYEYAAVGDMLNTASRLESLNKQLGTWLLASAQVVEGIDDLMLRPMGAFRVVGRKGPVEVFEVLGAHSRDDPQPTGPASIFETGLTAFRQGRWQEAEHAFQSVLASKADDGPSSFYVDLARTYQAIPPPGEWDGTVSLTSK